MSARNSKLPIIVFGVLAIAMIATRSNHFGSELELPDASLAVFFFGGLLLAGRLWFPALLVLAAAIDQVATVAEGVSRYCLTPAYAFLVPTYACMWLAGRLTQRDHRDGNVARLVAAARLGIAAGLAFLISNLSFFAFSGYFPAMTLADYVAATARYAVPYVAYTLAYGLAGGTIVMLARRHPRHADSASKG
jgi:hypothetical protein